MKNKFKYIISIILLILFTIFIILFPKIYFKKYDDNKNNFEIDLLNFTNNSLSNDEIIRLLNNRQFHISLNISEEKYLDIMQNIKLELKKINPDCYQVFLNQFDFNYEKINIDTNIIYLNNSKMESTMLIELSCFQPYYKKGFTALIDENSHTLFYFGVYGFNNYGPMVDITDDYIKYLGVSNKNMNIHAEFSETAINFFTQVI